MSGNVSDTDDRQIGSDLAKVDAYVNDAADYEEVPEITHEQFSRARKHRNGKPVDGCATPSTRGANGS